MTRHKLKSHRKKVKRRAAPGTPPGTITIDPLAPVPTIRIQAYGRESYVERQIAKVDDLRDMLGKWPVLWVNVDGLGDLHTLQKLAEIFDLHPLAMEDAVNVHQRAKVDVFGSRTFLVTQMLRMVDSLELEQISIFVGPNFLISFQEKPGWDCLEQVRERIRKCVTRIRDAGPGYLAYSLLDAVVDHYFPILEVYGEKLELLEDEIILQPDRRAIAEVHNIKRELLGIRRAIWPQREALNILVRDEVPNFDAETRIYLRDVYDHAVRIIDLVETYREICSDLMDLYLSSVSNRMNEVMRVLTVISTLFIPLTFIAGVYGMNFDPETSPWNMPELRWYLGYPLCILLMVFVSIGQMIFFWRRGWIGRGKWGEQALAPLEESRPKS